MSAQKKVQVVQVRSGNRRDKRTNQTLKALGLGRIGKVKEHALTPSTRGMIEAVQHLVETRGAE